MKESDALRIMYAAKQSRISNAHKKMQGESKGLQMLNALDKKKAFEAKFTKLANQNPKYVKAYGALIMRNFLFFLINLSYTLDI